MEVLTGCPSKSLNEKQNSSGLHYCYLVPRLTKHSGSPSSAINVKFLNGTVI